MVPLLHRLLCSFIPFLVAVGVAVAAESADLVFQVHLIRGTGGELPSPQKGKLVAPKLDAQFRRIFAWKAFWEMHHQQIRLAPGKKARIRLSPQREVEIDLGESGKRAVAAISDGKVISRIRDRIDAPMTLIGGDRDPKSSWFIVVRADKPSGD